MDKDAIKEIDDVLDYMAIKENIVFMTISDIRKGLSIAENKEIELYLILNKLLKDGYIELFEKEYTNTVNARISNAPETIRRYIITFEGRLFKQTGGYLQQFILDSQTSYHQKIYRGQLLVATWIAGIGTGGLLIWEICK